MELDRILAELGADKRCFPSEALAAAVAQREAVVPELLKCLELAADDPKALERSGRPMLPVIAVFLLAQFRESRAYPVILNLISVPGEVPCEVLGDVISGGLDRILATLWDGRLESLLGLVENPAIDPWVRGEALDAMRVLEANGLLPRERVVDTYRSLLRQPFQGDDEDLVWGQLVLAISNLPAPELLEEVRLAYERGVMDEFFIDYDDFASTTQGNVERKRHSDGPAEDLTLIDDTEAELIGWACFSEDNGDDDDFLDPDEAETLVPLDEGVGMISPLGTAGPEPFRRGPKIGRNDPCPCGSGKKYKKCCLGKADDGENSGVDADKV